MSQTYLSSLQQGLHEIFDQHPEVVLLGEDIVDPYGGAFKVSKGLSSKHPNRVLSTPISEASFTGMATATSRTIYPTLADIKAIMAEIGDAKKVVLSVYFRAPYVLDDASGLKPGDKVWCTVTDADEYDLWAEKRD